MQGNAPPPPLREEGDDVQGRRRATRTGVALVAVEAAAAAEADLTVEDADPVQHVVRSISTGVAHGATAIGALTLGDEPRPAATGSASGPDWSPIRSPAR